MKILKSAFNINAFILFYFYRNLTNKSDESKF